MGYRIFFAWADISAEFFANIYILRADITMCAHPNIWNLLRSVQIGGRLNHFKVWVPVHSSTKIPKGKEILQVFGQKRNHRPPKTGLRAK